MHGRHGGLSSNRESTCSDLGALQLWKYNFEVNNRRKITKQLRNRVEQVTEEDEIDRFNVRARFGLRMKPQARASDELTI